MNKVTVTKLQMEAIKRQRHVGVKLDDVIKVSIHNNFVGVSASLNDMSIEQIVLAWHGHAEIEINYVSFDEAAKAYDEGCLVSYHPERGSKITESLQNILIYSRLGDYSLNDLVKGKWTIEGGK